MAQTVLFGAMDMVARTGLLDTLRRHFVVEDTDLRDEDLLRSARSHEASTVVADIDAVGAVIASAEFLVAGISTARGRLQVALGGEQWQLDNPTPEEVCYIIRTRAPQRLA